MDLPDWMPQEAWSEFVAMRKRKKKPLTDYATKLAINKLDGLRRQGQDIEAVLNESIFHEWEGLFAVKSTKPNAPYESAKDRSRREASEKLTGRNRHEQHDIIIDV